MNQIPGIPISFLSEEMKCHLFVVLFFALTFGLGLESIEYCDNQPYELHGQLIQMHDLLLKLALVIFHTQFA